MTKTKANPPRHEQRSKTRPKPTAASPKRPPAKRPLPRPPARRRTTSACSCSALTSSKSRVALGLSARSRTWLPRPPSSWASASTKPAHPDVAEIAKKLPLGQLYATGRGFVPNVRQTLYSDVLVALSAEPQQAAVGPDDDKASTPVARGLPGSWDEIAPGHLVIAQESLANGWWEAIVLDRKDDMLTLRFRDYPRLPKFFRHRTAVALISPASDQ